MLDEADQPVLLRDDVAPIMASGNTSIISRVSYSVENVSFCWKDFKEVAG